MSSAAPASWQTRVLCSQKSNLWVRFRSGSLKQRESENRKRRRRNVELAAVSTSLPLPSCARNPDDEETRHRVRKMMTGHASTPVIKHAWCWLNISARATSPTPVLLHQQQPEPRLWLWACVCQYYKKGQTHQSLHCPVWALQNRAEIRLWSHLQSVSSDWDHEGKVTELNLSNCLERSYTSCLHMNYK